MTEAPPTERQVLYALVSGGFVVVVGVLVIAAWFAGFAPGWWSATSGAVTVGLAVLVALRWRRTRTILSASVMWFFAWTVVTLLVS